MFGNDLATLPNFPAEIRAPAGNRRRACRRSRSTSPTPTSSRRVTSPERAGRHEPAALKANLGDMGPGSTLIINSDAFDERDLAKAGYDDEPARGRLARRFTVYLVPMTSITLEATERAGREAARRRAVQELLRPRADLSGCTPGPTQPLVDWISAKYESRRWCATPTWPRCAPGGTSARPPSCSTTPTRSRRRPSPPGTYTNINGNTARRYGLIAGAQLAGLALVYASYPITPASDILHELVAPQELRRADHAGRGRDRRRRRSRSAHRSPARSA